MKIVQSVKEFKDEIASGKAVVDFFADWCGPCRQLGPVLEEIEANDASIKLIKVNVDELPSLAQEYGVFNIPNVHFFKDGKEVGGFVGFRYKGDVEKVIKESFGE
jgi:thioredoxin 1